MHDSCSFIDRLTVAIPDGQLRRFDHANKPRGNHRCWQVYHEEMGIRGDWACSGYEVVFAYEPLLEHSLMKPASPRS